MAADKRTVKQFTLTHTEDEIALPPIDETYFGFWSVLLLTVFLTVVSFIVWWVISALVVVFFLFFKKYRALGMVSGALWFIIYFPLQMAVNEFGWRLIEHYLSRLFD